MKNLKKTFCVLFSLVTVVTVSGQTNKLRIDSLKNEIKKITKRSLENDTLFVNALIALGNEYQKLDYDSALKYHSWALVSSLDINNTLKIAECNRNLGADYELLSDNQKALNYYQKAAELSQSLLHLPHSKIRRASELLYARCLGNIAGIYLNLSEHEKATKQFKYTLAYNKIIGNKIGIAQNLLNLGIVKYYQSSYDSALIYYQESLILLKELNRSSEIIAALANIAAVHSIRSDYHKALKSFFEILNLPFIEELGVQTKAQILGNVATTYYLMGDLSKSLEYNIKALKLEESLNAKAGTSMRLSNIGSIYREKGEFTKAKDYYSRALGIDKQTNRSIGIATNLMNLGLIETDLKNLDVGLDYLFQSLKITSSIKDSLGLSKNLLNIGGIYEEQEKYIDALEYYNQALLINEKIGRTEGQTVNLTAIAKVNLKLGRASSALKTANLSLAIAESIQSPERIMEASEILSKVYEKLRKLDLALLYSKRFHYLKDSLFNVENERKFIRTEFNNELQLVEERNRAMQAQKETEHNADIAQHKLYRNFLIVFIILVSIASTMVFAIYKRKRNAEQNQRETKLNLMLSETEMKALRSQMNPHFIFNALQSIQSFLLNHQLEETNTYLLKFAKLIRIVLENSSYKEVSLESDLKALELYMDLESLRLTHGFTYSFHIDESIDFEETTIPPLILQPFVENAIWHGLQHKPEKGHISIYINQKGNELHAVVEDNGIGRKGVEEVDQTNELKKESLGMKLTEERLRIFGELKKFSARLQVTDLFQGEISNGTRVELILPYTND